MKKTHYKHDELMKLIERKFDSFDQFCDTAKLDHVDFLCDLIDSDLSVDEIKKCVEVLEIPADKIEFYFFTIDESYRDPGRPKKEITKTTTPPENSRYYTISEAVRLLGVHRHTLQARLREGSLRGKLIGRTWRIYRDELFDNSNYLYRFEDDQDIFGDRYLTPAEIDAIDNHKEHGDPLSEGDIIAIARNLEVTLYRCNSDMSHEVCIYDCMDL